MLKARCELECLYETTYLDLTRGSRLFAIMYVYVYVYVYVYILGTFLCYCTCNLSASPLPKRYLRVEVELAGTQC